jgi:ribosome maturation factor RimP
MTGNELTKLLQPAIERQGYELSDLEVKLGSRSGVVRLFIDHPDGISLEDCEKVSQTVSALLDVEDPLPGQYNLEVSSPGLTRPLKSKRDFERAQGKKIRLITRTGPVYTGTLDIVSEGQLTLDVDGEPIKVAINDVSKANLHFEI